MLAFFRRFVGMLLVGFAVCGVALAQEEQAKGEVEAKLLELKTAAESADAAVEQGRPAAEAARQAAQKLSQDHTNLRLELAKAESSSKELEAKLPPLQEAAKKAVEAKTALETAATAATKAAEAAKGTEGEEAAVKADKEAAEKLAAGVKSAEEAAQAVKAVEDQLAAAKAIVAGHPEKIKAAEAALAAFQPQLEAAETTFATLQATAVQKHIAWEETLFSLGKLVSFRQQVAPVLQARCVACHNARTAKGRFNCETYANMMKGGESGESILAHNAGDSLMQIMIEDGSMPKEADPLTPEQQALFKKWIDSGAKLDAGVSATATLITIIPKLAQPMPPDAYRVPVPITAVTFSPDGNLLATSGYREVILWQTSDGSLVRRITNLAERPHDIEFSPDGQRLAVAAGTPGQLGEVKIFNVADGSVVADLLTTDDEAFAVAYSPDGTKLAATAADRSVRVYDLATNKQILMIEDHADWVLDIVWSPDGKLLATASRDKTSKIFKSDTGESQVTFNSHGEPVFSVLFLSDGTQVASAGRDNRIRVWGVTDAKQAREIRGFGGEVFRIVGTTDGLVASGCSDKVARLNKLADGGEVRKFAGHQDWIYSVAVHGPTKRIATGCHDGEVRIWNSEDGALIRTFVAAPGHHNPVAKAN